MSIFETKDSLYYSTTYISEINAIGLWIDDYRKPSKTIKQITNNDFKWARTYDEAIKILSSWHIGIIDFDHDLGEEKTGYDIAKYIVENNISIHGFRIHSANPVGSNNIYKLLTHYGYKENLEQ